MNTRTKLVFVLAVFMALSVALDAAFVASVFAAGVMGFVLHELTHWLAARVNGLDSDVDWIELNCYWELHSNPRINQRIALAPLAVGVIILWIWIAVYLSRELIWSYPGFIGWLIYTFGGARNDIAQYNEFEEGVKV